MWPQALLKDSMLTRFFRFCISCQPGSWSEGRVFMIKLVLIAIDRPFRKYLLHRDYPIVITVEPRQAIYLDTTTVGGTSPHKLPLILTFSSVHVFLPTPPKNRKCNTQLITGLVVKSWQQDWIVLIYTSASSNCIVISTYQEAIQVYLNIHLTV